MSAITIAQDYLDNTYGEGKFLVFTSIGCEGIDVHDSNGNYLTWFDNQAELEREMS